MCCAWYLESQCKSNGNHLDGVEFLSGLCTVSLWSSQPLELTLHCLSFKATAVSQYNWCILKVW